PPRIVGLIFFGDTFVGWLGVFAYLLVKRQIRLLTFDSRRSGIFEVVVFAAFSEWNYQFIALTIALWTQSLY
ncbi:1076_t:CDS:2, partial [Gigaspora rosea]